MIRCLAVPSDLSIRYHDHMLNLCSSQGADFVECDTVLTRDCRLVCRHEPLLSNTTNAGTTSLFAK